MRLPSAPSTIALALVLALAAGAAQAQAARAVTTTGQTKPPGSPVGGAPMKAASEAEMLKAQKAAAARDRAWDAKMRSTLGSICRGC